MGTNQSLIRALRNGSQADIARAITLIERNGENMSEFLRLLYEEDTNPVPLIGLTGFGGAGKSSLVGVLAESLLKVGKRIGIMAVDPTSPKSGGALLGDRIRLQHLFPNENLFFRSFANKGALGGLSPLLMESVKILEVASFDYIFLETVGIGQSEVDITHFADVVVLVLSPGLGDEIQFLKGGIMEIADILVMNKMDMPSANVSLAALEAYARLLDEPPRVVPVSAIERRNIDVLLSEINDCYCRKQESHELDQIRKQRNRALYHSWMMQMLEPIVDQRYSEAEVPYIAAKTFVDSIGRCLDEY